CEHRERQHQTGDARPRQAPDCRDRHYDERARGKYDLSRLAGAEPQESRPPGPFDVSAHGRKKTEQAARADRQREQHPTGEVVAVHEWPVVVLGDAELRFPEPIDLAVEGRLLRKREQRQRHAPPDEGARESRWFIAPSEGRTQRRCPYGPDENK